MLEMPKNHLDYPFATYYDHLRRQDPKSASMPSGPLQSTKLPLIPSATPPPENKLVSLYSGGKDKLGAYRPNSDMFEDEDRMKIFETRLGVTEKSNRALLEEVIRLQGELRVMVQRNEESIKDERVSRQQVEGSMHIVNDLIGKLSSRIKAAEEKIMEEKSALSSLVTHTKGVEQAVVASQQNLAIKKDTQASRIQELNIQLNEMQRNRDQLEKTTFTLTEELRNIKAKVESQAMELSGTVNDLKLRARRLEEENKMQLDALRKQGDMYTNTETSTTHLRGQVETRLSELRDVIMELRSRQDQEASERRNLEQQVQQKVNTLQQNLAEQNRKREEAMHAMDMIHREKEHTAENEKLRLQGKLTETVEEVNKRLLTKEIKLREELQEKYKELERMIHHEQQVRLKYEATVREENDKRWHGLKKLSDEEMVAIRDTFQSERQKNKEAVQKLDESISLIEKQLAEQKRQTDKVVAAEIKSRKHHEKATYEKLDHLNEKLSLATASLQTAIGGVTGNFAAHTDKLRAEIKSMIAASEQASTRSLTDMDARVQSMKQKINNLEEQLDGRISEATAILAQNLREKVESISLWQDVTSQTIRELNQSIQNLPNDIYAIEEKQKLLKSEMDSRMTTETDARIRDIETVKHELSLLKNRRQPQAATMEDMHEVQASVRKLAESVQTVKTVIGMKLQSEQKLRQEEVEDLQVEINKLRRRVDDTQPTGRNYDDDRNRNRRDDDRNGRGGYDRGRDDRYDHDRDDDRRDADRDRRDNDRDRRDSDRDRGDNDRERDRNDRDRDDRNDRDRDDRNDRDRDDRNDRDRDDRNDRDRDDRSDRGRDDRDRDDRYDRDRDREPAHGSR